MTKLNHHQNSMDWTVTVADASGQLHSSELGNVTYDGVLVAALGDARGFALGQRIALTIAADGVRLHIGGEIHWVGEKESYGRQGFAVRLDHFPNTVASALGFGPRHMISRMAA